jgi:hypothetical protein
MQLINPQIYLSVRLHGEVLRVDGDMSFDISKDLSEQPNEAEFVGHNLNIDTQSMLIEAGKNDAIIECYATTIESPSGPFSQAFAGEINYVANANAHPGTETTISCTSQKRNHREYWFQKTYSAGTYIDDIIDDLLAEINLPKGNDWETTTETIILSKTFVGPAYSLLQRFMFDRGMYCYIQDGKIYRSSVYFPPLDSLKKIDDYILTGGKNGYSSQREYQGSRRNATEYVLRSDPSPTVRNARNMIEMKTVIEVTGRLPDSLLKKTTRKRRKKKQIETYGAGDFVQFEAVDQRIEGMEFPFFFHPEFNPDNVFSYNGVLYRATEVHHDGDNYGGAWDTTVITDIFEDTNNDFVGQL